MWKNEIILSSLRVGPDRVRRRKFQKIRSINPVIPREAASIFQPVGLPKLVKSYRVLSYGASVTTKKWYLISQDSCIKGLLWREFTGYPTHNCNRSTQMFAKGESNCCRAYWGRSSGNVSIISLICWETTSNNYLVGSCFDDEVVAWNDLAPSNGSRLYIRALLSFVAFVEHIATRDPRRNRLPPRPISPALETVI